MSAGAEQLVVEDLLGLGIVRLFSDGSIVRGDESTIAPPGPFPDVPSVQWKDVVYDTARDLKVRVYKRSPAAAGEEGNNKLPVLVYFHGGGYCIGAYDQPMFHSCCQRFAADLPAVVLSVEYRRAPEHRLPAAIDDAATFFSWLRAHAAALEPWLEESADFSRTFVSGDSAGANLAHHVAVRVRSGSLATGPARVLLWPYFGGKERTESEATCLADVFLTLSLYNKI